jgi:hypothetical protein
MAQAGQRVIRGHPPASKGKQEYKDCEIFEHYLALARALRSSDFEPSLHFVSSNTNDYGSPGQLDATLDADLQSVRLTFVTDLSWLNASLDNTTD